ncbi:hypothetical protein NHX12_002107 [Muraenolepis orangiensis]|uniref:Ribonuclease A-domain domain-containing protein n=1 Tax=Muraenolepis orangiensis TaxID=630683 RepID=A0A9Q0D3P4_9TELE|nr:hypothetical protein NHX12_016854 [Muraenolepis orangiensis]KAJ3598601.1 hypothetical protein NHX12_002107 [Muraenolepis orangiensis]
MAGCQGLISLALLCLWLCHGSLAKNDLPCKPSKWNNAYSTFIKRHVHSQTPKSLDQNQWEKYIRQFGCDRPTQSFLDSSDLERVKAVCSDQGGRQYKENLCISSRPFSFVTVRSQSGTCGIRSVHRETKHLILACELLENQCLPVHFEGNRDSSKPDNNARGCQGGKKGAAAGLKASGLWLLLASALLMCNQ